MQHKTAESIRESAFISTQNLGNSGGHVVETEPGWYAANVLKDSPHTFQQALLILRGEGLCVTLVGVRERDGQCVTLLLLSDRVVIQKLPEVYLSAAGNALQRQKTCVLDFHHILFLAHIPLHAGVAACEAVLISQTAEKPPSGVPLLSWNLAGLLPASRLPGE